MKKISVLFLLIIPVILQFCSTTKNTVTKKAPSLTYTKDIKPLMLAHCTPCHFPPKGNKKAYDNYLAVKTDIDFIISRIQKNPGEKGFMPFKHAKLSDSTINVFVNWKKEGLLEN